MYVEDGQEWEFSRILRCKGLGKRRKFLVACSGYNECEAFWLLESKLCNALEILNDYKVSHGLS